MKIENCGNEIAVANKIKRWWETRHCGYDLQRFIRFSPIVRIETVLQKAIYRLLQGKEADISLASVQKSEPVETQRMFSIFYIINNFVDSKIFKLFCKFEILMILILKDHLSFFKLFYWHAVSLAVL